MLIGSQILMMLKQLVSSLEFAKKNISWFTMKFEFIALDLIRMEAEWPRSLLIDMPLLDKPILSIFFDS